MPRLPILLLSAALLLIGVPAQAGVPPDEQSVPPDSTVLLRIGHAFGAANVDSLLVDAADRIDLVIFGRGALCSRTQAAFVMQDFFRKHPPERASFQEQAHSEDSRSVIGTYWPEGAPSPIHIFVRLRELDDRWEIRSIRIERPTRR
jgi:hypothetical protein